MICLRNIHLVSLLTSYLKMSICTRNTTVNEISLIVIRRKSCFGYFGGMQSMFETSNVVKSRACRKLFKQALFVVCMTNRFGLIYSLCRFLFLFAGQKQTVHFVPETDKFKGCDTVGLVLELADHLRISLAMEKMRPLSAATV